MQAKSQQSSSAFPSRFFGLGLKGFLILAVILLLAEIAIIILVFGTDLIFTEIDLTNLAPSAQQVTLNLHSCIAKARTLALTST